MQVLRRPSELAAVIAEVELAEGTLPVSRLTGHMTVRNDLLAILCSPATSTRQTTRRLDFPLAGSVLHSVLPLGLREM